MCGQSIAYNTYATNIMISIGHFSVAIRGNVLFLRVSTSGAFAGEYWMGVLALTDAYSVANIESV